MSSEDHFSAPENGRDPGGPQPHEALREAPSIYSLEAQAASEALGQAHTVTPGDPRTPAPLQGPTQQDPAPQDLAFAGRVAAPPAPPVQVQDAPAKAPNAVVLPGAAALRAAAAHGALTYAAVLVASILILTLASLGFLASASTVSDQIADQVGVDPSDSGVLQALALPFQLAGLALLGTLKIAMTGALMGSAFEIGADVRALPLILTALAVAAGWWLGRRSERRSRSASVLERWILAAVSGAVTAVLALALSAVFAMRISESGMDLSATTASASLFFGAFFLGALGAGLGRSSVRSAGAGTASSPVVASVSAAGRAVAWHVVLFAVPAGVLIVLGAVLAAESEQVAAVITSAPLWIGTAAAYAYASAFLAPIAFSGGGESDTATLFDLPGWATALVVLWFLVVTVIAGLLVNAPSRRRGVPALASWFIVPAAFAVLGVVLTFVTAASATLVGIPMFQETRIALVPWAFLLFLLGGVLVELVARYLAPILLPLLPVAVRRVFARMVPMRHPAAVSTAGPTTGGAVQAAPGSSDAAAGALPVDSGTDPAFAPPVPLSPRARRRLIIGSLVTAGVVVVGTAAIITVSTLNSTVYGPEKQVSAYLDALRDGDADAAAEIVDPNMKAPLQVLLTDDIFGAAENRISGYELRSVNVYGDNALIMAEITQDGVTSSAQFTLHADGRQNVVFDNWQLEAPSTSWGIDVMIPEGMTAVTVNGVDVELPSEALEDSYSGQAAYTIPAFPGDYEILPAGEGKYLTLGAAQTATSVVEGYGDATRVEFEPTPTPALQADAEKQVLAQLEECLASTEPEPEGCPNSAYVFEDDEDLRGGSWTLDEEPEFSLNGGYEPGAYQLSSTNGSATYTYEYNAAYGDDAPRWKDDEADVTLFLRADVTVTGDTLTVDTDWG